MSEEAPNTLAEQYEHGDTAYDPELDSVQPSVAPPPGDVAASPEVSSPERQRDANGRFVPTEAEKPKHSSRLIRMARDLGIPDEEIEAMPTEQLDDTVYHLYRQEKELKASKADTPPEKPKPAPSDEIELEGADDFDPRLLDYLKKLHAKTKALEQHIANQGQREQARALETVAEQLDRLFDEQKQPERWGKGRGREMEAESPERLRRMAILQAMDRMRHGTLAQKFAKAVELIYGPGKARGAAPDDDLAERRKDWSDGTLSKPTHREGSSEPRGVKRAVKAAAAFMRENGMSEDHEADPEMPD